MKRMSLLIMIGLYLGLQPVAWAVKDTLSIELKTLYGKQISESSGDEVYFDVIRYSNQQTATHHRVPDFPMYWRSTQFKKLGKLEKPTLWTGKVAPGESIQIILSLVEHDVPPWNVDDHLGSVKLTAKNLDGKIEYTWGQPKFIDQPLVRQISSNPVKFEFSSEQALYEVVFEVRP